MFVRLQRFRTARALSAVLVTALFGALLSTALARPAAADEGDVGYPGPSTVGAGGGPHPTAEKPESKLWFHDGRWWAAMYEDDSRDFKIHALDPATHTWVDTGTVLNTNPNYRQDVLWDGSKLYVGSHRFGSTGSLDTSNPALLSRYSYNPSSGTWTQDGAAVQINPYRSETLVIEKDGDGRLWATWNRGTEIWVNHTICNPGCSDFNWATPFSLGSIAGIGSAASVDSDDISSLISFGGGRVGLMWSNQEHDAFYFAIHEPGTPPTSWTLETALAGTGLADDHINLATDGSRVFAAIKTSLDRSGQPETMLLTRGPGGGWSSTVTSDGANRLTRPIVLHDSSAGALHVFLADVSGGAVYRKTSSAGSPSFPPGKGEVFVVDASSFDMNDPTSTKQSVSSASGTVVLASDGDTRTYWHNAAGLVGGNVVTAAFEATPVAGESPLQVSFTDLSLGEPTSWLWDFGDGDTSTEQNPVHIYDEPGTFTVSLTVSDGTTTDDEVKADLISVSAPLPLDAEFSASDLSGGAPFSTTFTDLSTGSPTSWLWDFGDGQTSTAQHPTHQYAAPGVYTVSLTVTGSQGQDTETKAGYIVVTDAETLLPVADAYLRALSPNNNYGTNEFLRVRNANDGYRSLVKFEVPGGQATATTARLRMFVSDASPHAGDVYLVSDDWNELTVTDSNAPVPPPTPVALGGPAVVGEWHEWDVSSVVQGGGTYSFMIVSRDGNSAYFSSREGTNPPELVVGSASTAPLDAEFTTNPTTTQVGQAVSFTDTSTGSPTSWLWDFGDGTTSTEQHPTHAYDAPGTYSVSLTVSNETATDTETKIDHVTVLPPQPLTAEFTGTPTSGASPLVVSFTDNSSGAPTSWLWDFGDGTTSTEKDPTHVYTAPGTYDVTLTVGDGTGSDTETKTAYITVTDEVVAQLVADTHIRTGKSSNYGTVETLRARSGEYRPLLKFEVTGVGAGVTDAKLRLFVSDGSPHAGDVYLVGNDWTELGVNDTNAPAQPPTPVALGGLAVAGFWHEWDVSSAITGDGTYSLMIVSNSTNSVYFDSREGVNHPELVIGSATPAPLGAEFSASTVVGTAPLAVTFTDASSGSPTSWQWDFGDGGTSTEQNPTHVYTEPGTYTVSLTVGDGATTDTETKVDHITVTAPPALDADFTATPTSGPAPLAVSFTDTSSGSPTSWLWDFGDGGTSTERNPSHVYTEPGQYTVSLTVGDGAGSNTESRAAYITVTDPGEVVEVTATAAADAYLNAANPTKNYGGLDTLRLRAGQYRSVLRFDVSGVPSATSAKLRLFSTDGSPHAGDVFLVSSAWTELGVTDANAPLPPPVPVAVGSSVADGQWFEWDVSQAVTGDGSYSFLLVSNSTNSVFYDSREGANPPQLVVTGSGAQGAPGAPTAAFAAAPLTGEVPLVVSFADASTGSPTSWLWDFGDGTTSNERHPTHTYTAPGSYTVSLTVTNGQGSDTVTKVDLVDVNAPGGPGGGAVLTATADAYLNAANPTKNYGGVDLLRVRAGQYRSLVRFDVSGSAGVTSVKLRLFSTDGSPHAGDVYLVDNTWTELGVTDANAPLPPAVPVAVGGSVGNGQWFEWDVTPVISGDGTYSFMIVSNSTNSAFYDSREGANAPHLVLSGGTP